MGLPSQLDSGMEWELEEIEPGNLGFTERKFMQRQIGRVDYLGEKDFCDRGIRKSYLETISLSFTRRERIGNKN